MSQITPEIAALTAALLDRVQVTGQEAMVWVRCHQALLAVANPRPTPGLPHTPAETSAE